MYDTCSICYLTRITVHEDNIKACLQEKTETVLVEQVTTVTEDAPGEFTVETKKEEAVIPADQKLEVLSLKLDQNAEWQSSSLRESHCSP